jgi:hypothetical protein
VPVGCKIESACRSFKQYNALDIWFVLSSNNRATHAHVHPWYSISFPKAFRLFQPACPHFLPLSLSGDVYFSRGQRTANLPDEVRAQVLVLGGHCE